MSLLSVVGGFIIVSRCKHYRVYGFREGAGKRGSDLSSALKKIINNNTSSKFTKNIPRTTFPHPFSANTFTGIILNPTSHGQINIRIF